MLECVGDVLISGKAGSIEHDHYRPRPILILYFADKLLETGAVVIFSAFDGINKFSDGQITA
nr:hypothetical protein [Nitrosovibrio tenuis]